MKDGVGYIFCLNDLAWEKNSIVTASGHAIFTPATPTFCSLTRRVITTINNRKPVRYVFNI